MIEKIEDIFLTTSNVKKEIIQIDGIISYDEVEIYLIWK